MTSKYNIFCDYVDQWSYLLNINQYEYQFIKVKEPRSDDTEMFTAVADVGLYQDHNLVIVQFYPKGNKATKERLWYFACHECLHVCLWPLLRLEDTFRDKKHTKNPNVGLLLIEAMEQTVDNLARQLVLLHPLSDIID